jgi:iron(II)-dependent oxidoreductase
LPTEAEWEVAATYDQKMQRHIYPWGNDEVTQKRADFGKDRENEAPSPVGEHPEGSASCGAQNMVGSVWEAMVSNYMDYPTKSDILVEDFTLGNPNRFLRIAEKEYYKVSWRGGCWQDDKIHLNSSYRAGVTSNFGGSENGFRLVLASSKTN